MLGAEVNVRHEDGAEEIVTVRQIPLRDYQRALIKSDDEMEFTGLCCDKSVDWVRTLTPPSYEALQAKARELNADFFAFLQRRREDRRRMMGPEFWRMVADSMPQSPASSPSPAGQ